MEYVLCSINLSSFKNDSHWISISLLTVTFCILQLKISRLFSSCNIHMMAHPFIQKFCNVVVYLLSYDGNGSVILQYSICHISITHKYSIFNAADAILLSEGRVHYLLLGFLDNITYVSNIFTTFLNLLLKYWSIRF